MFIRPSGCQFLTPNLPIITSNGGGATASISVTAPSQTVTTVIAKASTAPVYSITGFDVALFTIVSDTGVLTFTAASAAGTYHINAIATTLYGSDSQALTITVS